MGRILCFRPQKLCLLSLWLWMLAWTGHVLHSRANGIWPAPFNGTLGTLWGSTKDRLHQTLQGTHSWKTVRQCEINGSKIYTCGQGYRSVPCKGNQTLSLQNIATWYNEYFELKTIKDQQMLEETFLYLWKDLQDPPRITIVFPSLPITTLLQKNCNKRMKECNHTWTYPRLIQFPKRTIYKSNSVAGNHWLCLHRTTCISHRPPPICKKAI